MSIDGNQVSIGAEIKREKEEKEGKTLVRSERYYGKQFRSFTLAHDIDEAKAEAEYNERWRAEIDAAEKSRRGKQEARNQIVCRAVRRLFQ